MNRRDMIKDLYSPPKPGEKLAMANSSPAKDESPPERVLAGPVRSMGLALGRIEHESRVLQETLATGVTIVDLDPSVIEASFVRDRLPDLDNDFAGFKRSIAENGQEVPILVRPHPTKDGYYQIAFGHRRKRACEELGLKVRAVVRTMSDRDLVVAQGVENSQRKDLSYIERSLYAARLEDRGFERTVICDALATDKGELSKLISVARAVPEQIIEAVGPAPKAGRRRWLALAEALENSAGRSSAARATKDPDLAKADTDTRFVRVFAAATAHARKTPEVTSWKSQNGRASAAVTRTDKVINLAFDPRSEPEFAEFVASKLDELYSTFLSKAKA